ncbi:Homeobox domain-containing protein [Caenorhabditis elegans]|uniref:Homeobox domain-containing protein n=1 Tax=Caenorhabditis elegans TaxID=6239 RepID=O17184_CAEEL|nr:Homeobox domain-containing protein [Caenorhabditis elegans]CCD69861.1 Homeobox domain-containing protein [Caenorhabditis elegans]|eukprot:NP_494332.2 C. Elegans Homeobox [Caenorhabditis elegans]
MSRNQLLESSQVEEIDMWEILKNSSNVLRDYYDMGNFKISGNKEKLVALTGMSDRQIELHLQKYRREDKKNGVIIPKSVYTPEQHAVLREGFEHCSWLSKSTLNKLASESGLTRTQVSTWFSKERRVRAGKKSKRSKKIVKTETPAFVLSYQPLEQFLQKQAGEKTRQLVYFSIENILSQNFPRKN